MKTLKLSLVALGLCTFIFTSCKKDKVDPKTGNKPPIVLDCDYFSEDRVLVDDPDAPVDYVITCVMAVHADIKIEPGVVIEFEQDAGIEVDDFNIPKASLSAIGTSSKPIIFRGVKKEKGYWRGIMFDSNSPDNRLEYTKVEYAGGKRFNSNGQMGAVHLYADGKLTIKNSEITNSSTFGLNAVYNAAELVFENNKINNNETPVTISPELIGAMTNSNDFKGNAKDFIVIESGSIINATTWHKVNVPYQILNSSTYNYSKGIAVKNILTIEPGVHMEYEAQTKLSIAEDVGAIKAVGTSSDPIIFTAVNKVQNGWVGIYFNSAHPLNEIGFAEFWYSGKTTGSGDSESGTIRLWYNNLLNIHDVTFKNINGCAINYGILASQSGNSLLTYSNLTLDAGACEIKCFGQGCI